MESGAFLWILTHQATSFIGIVLKRSIFEVSLFGMRTDMEVIASEPHEVVLSENWLFFHQPISFINLKKRKDFHLFYEIGNDLKNLTHKEVGIRKFVQWVQKCKKLDYNLTG